MSFTEKILKLFEAVHPKVQPLFDPEKQKRTFPKKALEKFLSKKSIKSSLHNAQPQEIADLIASAEDYHLVPSEALTQYLANVWDKVPEGIKKAIEGSKDPRAPTQASSDFVINRELGEWAERVVMDAINKTDLDVTAVSYGRKDKLIAGEPGYKELFVAHQEELEELGKRPDLLLFRQDGASRNFDGKDAAELIPEARKAVAAFEVRSSKQSLDAGRDPGKLSFTPKVEDIRNVVKWIEVHEVPHYYVQVLFGKVYAIGFERILELLAHSPKSGKFRILRVPRNQFKSTIFIPLTAGTLLSTQFQQPQTLEAEFKPLSEGRVIVVVKFEGGSVAFDRAEVGRLMEAAEKAKGQPIGQDGSAGLPSEASPS